MIEVFLYTTLSCTQSDALLLKIREDENLSDHIKLELVQTVKNAAPQCEWYWDAND